MDKKKWTEEELGDILSKERTIGREIDIRRCYEVMPTKYNNVILIIPEDKADLSSMFQAYIIPNIVDIDKEAYWKLQDYLDGEKELEKGGGDEH
ncbi:MAG: hypothetical protein DRP62_01565 [Planctomycetota bacterium]|nr:MAG: hypothetical protein DRP62_01565 [Planctomycetota bacterium]